MNHKSRDKIIGLTMPAVLALVLILAFTGCKAPEQVDISKAVSDNENRLFDYQQIELKNGLEVITLEDFSCPIVAVQLWYHVGSKNERPDRQGFAHMFEHMMFKGTDRVGLSEHFDLVNSVGGTNNGYTSFDKTVYLETLPADQLALALWLEAERMAFLKIDQENFDTERKVVEEELRLKHSRPYGTLMEKLATQLYKTHPYRWMPIGNISHLRTSSVPELRDFWTRFYVPNNAVLIIVGAVKHADAQQLARKYFEWIPKCPEPKRVTVREPRQSRPKTIVIDDENAPAPLAGMIWRTIPLGHSDEVVLDMLSEILGGGNSSRMYRRLVAADQLAVNTLATTWNLEHDGIFIAGAMQSPQSDANEVLDIIKKQIEQIKTAAVTPAELLKARNQMLKRVVTENLTIESRASMLGAAAVEKADVSRVNTMLDEISAVTVDDIQRVAKKYLTDSAVFTVIVKRNTKGALAGKGPDEDAPLTSQREIKPPTPGRKGVVRAADFPTKPPLKPLKGSRPIPDYSRTTLPNGLKVIVVQNHEVPFVSIKLGLLSGAWTEEKPGTAAMAMNMLTKGTAKHSEAELAEELERHAISLGGSAGMDTSQVGAGCLSEHVERAMELLAEVVLEPSFAEDEFEKLRKQVLTGLAIEMQRPDYLADREFRRRLYGSHPYARTVQGELADIKTLAVEDLKQWHNRFVRPNEATLIFAGDIDRDRAVKLTEKTLGRWKANPAKAPTASSDFPQPDNTHIYLVNLPGSMQSQIRAGHRGITRHRQPEYFISRIVSNYFGWSFNSRLNENIRIKKGLTYSVWGSYIAQQMAGKFEVNTSTKTDSTADAVRAVLDEIKRLRDEGPTEKELETSKSYFAGSFVRNRETPQQVGRDLWLIESQDLGDDYLDRLLEKIADTSSADCKKLVTDTLKPDKTIVVVLADADKVKADLEKIAPVTVVAAD